MYEARPIETQYHGRLFRSRLEARWAVFFNRLRVHYEYEKQGYAFPYVGNYLPDFWLPDVSVRSYQPGVWIEIKGQKPTAKEMELCRHLGEFTNSPVILFVGEPTHINERTPSNGVQLSPWYDEDMFFWVCPCCQHTKIEYGFEGTYDNCPQCQASGGFVSAELRLAVEAARQSRFEFGQTPDS